MKLNKFNIVLLVLSIFLFHGCSIRTDFFIQNFTNDSKSILITYNYLREQNFEYVEGILNPKKFNNSDDIVLKTIKHSLINDNTIAIKISPMSTVRIAKSTNYRWLNFDIKEFIIDDNRIDIESITSKSKRIKDDYVYKIK